MSGNTMFEEQTRCGSCLSDRIYVLQDEDGIGFCMDCKAQVNNFKIVGGVGYHEFLRLKGLLPREPECANEKDRAEKAREDAVKIREDMTKLKMMTRPAAAPSVPVKIHIPTVEKPAEKPSKPSETIAKPEKSSEPSVVARAKNWLFGKAAEKAFEVIAKPPPKPEVKPPPKAEKPSDVAKDNKKETGLPKISEMWSVGPCAGCGLKAKKSGKVHSTKASGGLRFIVIIEASGNDYYGCFMCCRKV